MIIEVWLSHAVEGEFKIQGSDGWREAQVGLERDIENFWTLAEFFQSPFNAYGRMRTWMLMVEENHGPDAVIGAYCRYSPEERGFQWYELFIGEQAVGSFAESVGDDLGHGLEFGFVLKSFWAKMISRMETPVNVQSPEDLDGNAVDVIAPLLVTQSSQKIEKKNISFEQLKFWATKNVVTDMFSTDNYLQVGFDNTYEIEEIENTYSIPTDINPDLPVPIFSAKEAGETRIQVEMSIMALNLLGSMSLEFINSSSKIGAYIQINNDSPIALSHAIESYPGIYFSDVDDIRTVVLNVYTYDDIINLSVGSKIRIFYRILDDNFGDGSASHIILGTNEYQDNGSGVHGLEYNNRDYSLIIGNNRTSLRLTSQTVYPETQAHGFLTHDLLASVIKRISGANFFSEYLGSPNTVARQYDYTGCAADFMHYKGLQLRQYTLTEKPFFISLADIWSGVDPVHCLSLGYEKIDGQDCVVVRPRAEVFDDSQFSVMLSNVRTISRAYDKELFYNLIEIGYEKWESEDISGIDDPQSKRNYATILKKIGKKVQILSTMIGASLAFETTRRFVEKKSADYKFDNETFIQAVRYSEGEFHPELSEEFSDVTGLKNEETRYNKRITSARNLLRWLDFLCGGLKSYPDSFLKFTGGDGNYDMQATMEPGCPGDFDGEPLSEKQDIPVSGNPLFLPIVYTITHKLRFTEWLSILANKNIAIGVSQTDTNHQAFFIKKLSFRLSDGYLNLDAWPKRFFKLRVIQDETTEHENVNADIFDDTFNDTFN
jgi:hypothetical protein